MDILFRPHRLEGTMKGPFSKSMSQRMLLAAKLAGGDAKTIRSDMKPCEDVFAMRDAIKALDEDAPEIFCGESATCLRLMLPVVAAIKDSAVFTGRGSLPRRPLQPLWDQLQEHGVDLATSEKEGVICVSNGKLHGGDFFLPGNVSSQFISGLLFALPLTKEGGIIHLTTPLMAAPYVDMTIYVLKMFSIEVEQEFDRYVVPGNQQFKLPETIPSDGLSPERDWSHAAFFLVANALGSDVRVCGLTNFSVQGDKVIWDIVREYEKNGIKDFDATDCPDLVPPIAILMALTPGTHRILNAEKLRSKECDRLDALRTNINALGGKCDFGARENASASAGASAVTGAGAGAGAGASLVIEGVPTLKGGVVDSFGDHRIAMAMAIAATKCEGNLLLRNAECVRKSFVLFYQMHKWVGGIIEEK